MGGGGEAISFPSRLRISQWARSLLLRRRLLEIPPTFQHHRHFPTLLPQPIPGPLCFPWGNTDASTSPTADRRRTKHSLPHTRGEAYFPELDADAIIIWGGETKGLSWGKEGEGLLGCARANPNNRANKQHIKWPLERRPPFFSCGGSSGRLLL